MRVFRIEREKYLKEILSGRGAALSRGNRWNSLNTPMVYTSGSKSLAVLEVLTRVDLFQDLPDDRLLVTLNISDSVAMHEMTENELPESWNIFPAGPETRTIGDLFTRSNHFLLLKVPSSLINGEYNYLINPLHPEIHNIKIVSTEPLDTSRWRR